MSEVDTHALPIGHRLDEYEIVRVLGMGGFGITYLAFDHQLDGPVALKEYFPAGFVVRTRDLSVTPVSTGNQGTFAWGLDRFVDEARAIRRFRHRNVVRAYRYIQAHGTAYIAMEYVEGDSLASILETRGPLPAAEWRPWMDRLLDGVAHVHSHGYLHRDIKPANIVIRTTDNEPVLIDFGAARVAASERTLTQVLTLEYAPIEQHGSEGRQGPPTDIYSLAAVSYGALTGEPPPAAPDRVLEDRYQPLTERIRGADRAWLAAIDQGLALRPLDRPQTAAAWRTALNKANLDDIPRTKAADREFERPKNNLAGQNWNGVLSGRHRLTSNRTFGAGMTAAAVCVLVMVMLIWQEQRNVQLGEDVTSSTPAPDSAAQQQRGEDISPMPWELPRPTPEESLATLLSLAERRRADADAAPLSSSESEDDGQEAVQVRESGLRTNSAYLTHGSDQEGAARGAQVGGNVTAPTVIYQVNAEYTEEARKARHEGVVRLEAIVRADGSVQVLRVLQSLGFGLDEKAIEALQQWEFRPGMRDGEAVAVDFIFEFNFNLR